MEQGLLSGVHRGATAQDSVNLWGRTGVQWWDNQAR